MAPHCNVIECIKEGTTKCSANCAECSGRSICLYLSRCVFIFWGRATIVIFLKPRVCRAGQLMSRLYVKKLWNEFGFGQCVHSSKCSACSSLELAAASFFGNERSVAMKEFYFRVVAWLLSCAAFVSSTLWVELGSILVQFRNEKKRPRRGNAHWHSNGFASGPTKISFTTVAGHFGLLKRSLSFSMEKSVWTKRARFSCVGGLFGNRKAFRSGTHSKQYRLAHCECS